jgi:hypothetical protein
LATTRTPRITVFADGRRFIDKRYLGVRIAMRVGAITQEQAEKRLRVEMARIEYERERKHTHAPPPLTAAPRYIAQSRGKRSIDWSSGTSNCLGSTSEARTTALA